ncbi:MAG: hypothetical protein K6A43_06865 [Treponema sp.]|nr:hypothetical protein [Treponema sp.]
MQNANPIFGRKVFFINPSLFIEHLICDPLKELEYEVYILNDYKYAKPVISRFRDSICFIAIDSEMSFSEWYNFIKSFETDIDLSNMFVGVLSETAKLVDKEKFLANLNLAGGFINIDKKAIGVFDKVKDVLDKNDAKGRRQYLRLNVTAALVNGYIAAKDKLYSISVANISSVGIACVFKKNIEHLFVENSVLPNVSLTIARRSIVMNCIVLKKLPIESDPTSMTGVLLFAKDTASEVRGYIRKFVYDFYDAEMNLVKSKITKDTSSYKTPDVYKELPTTGSVRDDSDSEDGSNIVIDERSNFGSASLDDV